MPAEKSAYEKLNKRQRDFVDAYMAQGVGRGNATEAAKAANYSEHTARQQGSRLLSNADIQAAIKERVNELKIGADEVLVRMAQIARGSLGEFLTFDGETFRLDLAAAKKADKLGLLKKLKVTTLHRSIEVDDDAMTTEIVQNVDLEIHDAMAALTTLMRHLGLLGPTGTKDDPLHVELDSAKDELAHLIGRYAERTGEAGLDSESDAGTGTGDPL